MNRLKLLRDVERDWWQLRPRQRAEFEEQFGTWAGLRINEKDECLRRFLKDLKRREGEEAERKRAEVRAAERREREIRRDKVAERRHGERIAAMQNSLQPVNHGLRDLAVGIGEIRNQIGEVGRRQEINERQVGELGRRLDARKLEAAHSPETPTTSREPPTTVVYPMTFITDDCRYIKDGPKGCIQVYQGSDGHLYGTCGIGDQVRSRERLPRVLSTARDTADCPSNGMFVVCKYLEFEKVRRS